MGIFDKFKNLFKKEEEKEVNAYDEGLKKTIEYFRGKLGL